MLTEKRYEVILKCLNEKNSITVTELKELFGKSIRGSSCSGFRIYNR